MPLLRFFPVYVHTYEGKGSTNHVFFAYTEDGKHIAVQVKYANWYYVNLERGNASYEKICQVLEPISGVSVEHPNVGEDLSTIVKQMRSTVDSHNMVSVVRVFTDTYTARSESVRILTNHAIEVHEDDYMLTGILKMMSDRKIARYKWLQADVAHVAEHVTKFGTEYIASSDTLTLARDEHGEPIVLPPPTFSILSYDLETDRDSHARVPDSLGGDENAIRMACVTFATKDCFEEHAIVLGPDVTPVFKKFAPFHLEPSRIEVGDNKFLDFAGVKIHTVSREIDLVVKLLDMITEIDPDIITGHNILGYDNKYLLNRYRYLIMDTMTRSKGEDEEKNNSVRLPNLSRLAKYGTKITPVKMYNSQAQIEGIYYDAPGRIWIDTYPVAVRGLLGTMKNNKLATIAEVHLGMEKNDVDYEDMFRYFFLWRAWNASKKNAGNAPTTKHIHTLAKKVRSEYERAVKKHNKRVPRLPNKGTAAFRWNIEYLNNLISIINGMNQREKKMNLYTAEDSVKIDMAAKYAELVETCKECIAKWNIPILSEEETDTEEMIAILWWLVTLYCLQDTRIPYQVLERKGIVPVLLEQGNVFSVDVNDVLLRGQVYTVTNSQYGYAAEQGFMMEFSQQGGPVTPYDYEGGYVGKGEAGVKILDDDSAIFSIDFASLYPTIIIAHNLCYTTWVPMHMRDAHLNTATQNIGSKRMPKDGELNPNYIWLKYESTIHSSIDKYKGELAGILQECAIVAEMDHLMMLKEAALRQADIGKRDSPELKQMNAALVGIANPKCAHDSDTQMDMRNRIDTLLTYVVQLQQIIDAPYGEKGAKMCNIWNIPNEKLKKTHTHWFLKACVLEGIVPAMLWQQFLARRNIKGRMGAAFKAGNISMGNTYNAQQLATKTSMNASYGALGTEENRLANFPAAEVVTYIGRMAILEVNREVERRGIGTTVYNDTDSGFIRVDGITEKFGRDAKKFKAYGVSSAAELSALFPRPMALECENIFVAMFLKGPKMYACIKWDKCTLDIAYYTMEYVNRLGLLYIKGLAPVRKDKYTYNKQALRETIYRILVRQSWQELIGLLEYALQDIWSLRDAPVSDRVLARLFAYNMGVSAKALDGGKGTMAQWIPLYEQKYKQKPSVGERFELVVTDDGSKKLTKSASKLRTIAWMRDEKRKLDVEHYVEAFSKEGNILELMHIAHKDMIPKDCIRRYYLPLLKRHGKIPPEMSALYVAPEAA